MAVDTWRKIVYTVNPFKFVNWHLTCNRKQEQSCHAMHVCLEVTDKQSNMVNRKEMRLVFCREDTIGIR